MRRKSPLDRLRAICLALPETHEVEAWGAPTFRVRNKLFAMYAAAENHHGRGIPGVWVKSTHVNQDLLLRADPARFFLPPSVGPSGWVGVRLNGRPEWGMLSELIRDAYRLTAPKKLLATLDSTEADRKSARPVKGR